MEIFDFPGQIVPYLKRKRKNIIQRSLCKPSKRGSLEIKPIEVPRAEHVRMRIENVFPAISAQSKTGLKAAELCRPESSRTRQGHVRLLLKRGCCCSCHSEHFKNPVILSAPKQSRFLRFCDWWVFQCNKGAAQHDSSQVKLMSSLQQVTECPMMVGGDNDSKLPHMGKDRLRPPEDLPSSLVCDPVPN